jgi:hypothetical protein
MSTSFLVWARERLYKIGIFPRHVISIESTIKNTVLNFSVCGKRFDWQKAPALSCCSVKSLALPRDQSVKCVMAWNVF